MGMSASASGDDAGPMMEINTTPLIDVMLVLLIMFIITLPPPTHAVKIDLPPDCKQLPQGCPPKPPIDPIVNTLYIAPNDTLTWNGVGIDLNTLVETLKDTVAEAKPPELRIQPDPESRHEMVIKVIRATKYAKVKNMGFVGNENYSDY
jgi:biopolymer transport protein ExbD